MHRFLQYAIRLAMRMLFGAAAGVVFPMAGAVPHAEEAGLLGSVKLPWANTEDEVATNIAIGSLREWLLKALKTERGVHVETLLVSVGALAGFAAQSAVFVRLAKRDIPLPPDAATMSPEALNDYLLSSKLLAIAAPQSGERYYMGDLINGYLVQEDQTRDHPLWAIVAAAAIETAMKAAELPDCDAIFARVASRIGTPEFDVLQVAEHRPQMSPRLALDTLWPQAKLILARTDGPGPAKGHSVRPEHWPLVMALVAGQFVTLTKGTLDLKIRLELLMESAIMMSKVDPKTVPQSVPEQK
jgi:hypothetical protein